MAKKAATPATITLKHLAAALAEEHDLSKKAAEAIVHRMGDLEIQIARKVGDTQVLFGSVTTSDIAAALLAKGGWEGDRLPAGASVLRYTAIEFHDGGPHDPL